MKLVWYNRKRITKRLKTVLNGQKHWKTGEKKRKWSIKTLENGKKKKTVENNWTRLKRLKTVESTWKQLKIVKNGLKKTVINNWKRSKTVKNGLKQVKWNTLVFQHYWIRANDSIRLVQQDFRLDHKKNCKNNVFQWK